MSDEEIRSRIKRRLNYAGATPSFGQVRQLEDYFRLLAKWNKQLNLTSADVDPPTDDGVDHLLIEPVAAARSVIGADDYLVDIGSGSASPAIPLKIAAPQLRLLMIERDGRKSAFLRDAIQQLELTDVQIVNSGFEDLGITASLDEADLVSVRTARPTPGLLTRVRDILRPGGRVLWFTSSAGSQEVLQSVDDILTAESITSLIPNTHAQLLILSKAARSG